MFYFFKRIFSYFCPEICYVITKLKFIEFCIDCLKECKGFWQFKPEISSKFFALQINHDMQYLFPQNINSFLEFLSKFNNAVIMPEWIDMLQNRYDCIVVIHTKNTYKHYYNVTNFSESALYKILIRENLRHGNNLKAIGPNADKIQTFINNAKKIQNSEVLKTYHILYSKIFSELIFDFDKDPTFIDNILNAIKEIFFQNHNIKFIYYNKSFIITKHNGLFQEYHILNYDKDFYTLQNYNFYNDTIYFMYNINDFLLNLSTDLIYEQYINQ